MALVWFWHRDANMAMLAASSLYVFLPLIAILIAVGATERYFENQQNENEDNNPPSPRNNSPRH
jgi:Co/Zn/Cd efflux system component